MSKLTNKLCLKVLKAKHSALKMLKNERGEANIIAIILVLAIVIALAVIFRKQLSDLFNKIWGSLFSEVDDVIS